MTVDPEEQAARSRQAEEEARRQAARMERAAQEPELQREGLRQNNLIYGGLTAAGLLLVQPFLTVASLDWSAEICVIAFSVAIPLLAALVLLNRQEDFRRRATDSLTVQVTHSLALLLAFIGVVAGFWHIMWLAGVGVLVSAFAAIMVHSAGYFRLERSEGSMPAPAEPPRPRAEDAR